MSHGTGLNTADTLDDIENRTLSAIRQAPRQHRTAVQKHAGHIQPHQRHHQARQRLIAATESHQGIIAMSAHHQLNAVGDELT